MSGMQSPAGRGAAGRTRSQAQGPPQVQPPQVPQQQQPPEIAQLQAQVQQLLTQVQNQSNTIANLQQQQAAAAPAPAPARFAVAPAAHATGFLDFDKKETKKAKKSGNSNGGKTKCYCTEHGENWTHDTKDCRTLQNKAKGNNNNNNGRFQNKTWNRKSEEAKKEATKELATLIAKQVKKGVKKQLAAADKKRKNDNDGDSDKDCAPLQSLTRAIDGFNCEQFENLCIDDSKVSC